MVTDAGLPQLLLGRLRDEVEASAALLDYTPAGWHSAAQRACSARVSELRRDLDGLSAVLEKALHVASVLTAAE